MNAITNIDEWRDLRAKKAQQKAIDHERARWKKKDYKPGSIKPTSSQQYTKVYKRKESQRVVQKRRQVRLEREQADRAWREENLHQKHRELELRRRAELRAKRLAALPQLSDEMAELLKSNSRELMTLEDAAEALCVDSKHARKILRQYGAEEAAPGLYLRGSVERAALVYGNEHPRVSLNSARFFTYDQAAEFVGVHRDTIKHRARWDGWRKVYAYVPEIGQTLVMFPAAVIHEYKKQYNEWLNAGDSDHTHCLKLRQRRRLSQRKMKRR